MREDFLMTVVVIMRASAGVGRAVVRRFAVDGARIGLIARGPERLEAAVREMGSEALALPRFIHGANTGWGCRQ
jgi:NADP-dependent 3-hydroxy acid dehydrogenase YdfG